MMKRKDALVYMREAGYHGDTKSFTRLLIENRIGRPAANAEWQRGEGMKQAGVPCSCIDCKQTSA